MVGLFGLWPVGDIFYRFAESHSILGLNFNAFCGVCEVCWNIWSIAIEIGRDRCLLSYLLPNSCSISASYGSQEVVSRVIGHDPNYQMFGSALCKNSAQPIDYHNTANEMSRPFLSTRFFHFF